MADAWDLRARRVCLTLGLALWDGPGVSAKPRRLPQPSSRFLDPVGTQPSPRLCAIGVSLARLPGVLLKLPIALLSG